MASAPLIPQSPPTRPVAIEQYKRRLLYSRRVSDYTVCRRNDNATTTISLFQFLTSVDTGRCIERSTHVVYNDRQQTFCRHFRAFTIRSYLRHYSHWPNNFFLIFARFQDFQNRSAHFEKFKDKLEISGISRRVRGPPPTNNTTITFNFCLSSHFFIKLNFERIRQLKRQTRCHIVPR